MTTFDSTDTSTMSTTATDPARNLATVQAMYAAFGRGDVPYILDQLADDISWDEGIRATDVPWLQSGRGKDAVVRFFTTLGSSVQFTKFEPVSITGDGDHVVGVIREAAIVNSTGREMAEELFVHFWTFGADGKVRAFRHIGDFALHEAALQPR